MEKLYDENFNMTDDAKNIQEEFECLLKPFFEKYGQIYHPFEFEFMINSSITFLNVRNFLTTVTVKKHGL